jgi:hypothetical protein
MEMLISGVHGYKSYIWGLWKVNGRDTQDWLIVIASESSNSFQDILPYQV